MESGKADVFLTYCTNAILAQQGGGEPPDRRRSRRSCRRGGIRDGRARRARPQPGNPARPLYPGRGRANDPGEAWLRARRSRRTCSGRIALAVAAVALLLGTAAPALARTVTDSAGRKVEVPDRIERVFAAGPPASILLYMLAPEKMTGWPNPPTPEERPYIARAVSRPAGARTPHRPRRHGQPRGGAQDQARPDPRLRLRARHLRLARRQRAGADQDPLHPDRRPLRGDAGGAAAAGRHPRRSRSAASSLPTTSRTLSPPSTRCSRQRPPEKRPRVYLARGPDGLETGVVGSINTEIIERAGGRNVAEAPGQSGLVRASMEQVIVADPEIILTWDRNFFERVTKDPLWAGIRAVREQRVLSRAHRAVRLDRPAAVAQPRDRAQMAGGAVLPRQVPPTTCARPRAPSIVSSITWT